MRRSTRAAAFLVAALVVIACSATVANAAKKSVPTLNLAGYSFKTTYQSGFDQGNTFRQEYTAKGAKFIGLEGPLKGSVTTNISYVAVSLGHNQVEILVTFPSGLPEPFPNGLQDVIIFNLNTGITSTATTIPGQVPWTPSGGKVQILKKGNHSIP